MAISRYNQPIQSQYIPMGINPQMYEMLARKRYEDWAASEGAIDTFSNKLNALKAYNGKKEDVENLNKIRSTYLNNINSIVEKTNGNPSAMLPYLNSLNRSFNQDMLSGQLYDINYRYTKGVETEKDARERYSQGKLSDFAFNYQMKDPTSGVLARQSPEIGIEMNKWIEDNGSMQPEDLQANALNFARNQFKDEYAYAQEAGDDAVAQLDEQVNAAVLNKLKGLGYGNATGSGKNSLDKEAPPAIQNVPVDLGMNENLLDNEEIEKTVQMVKDSSKPLDWSSQSVGVDVPQEHSMVLNEMYGDQKNIDDIVNKYVDEYGYDDNISELSSDNMLLETHVNQFRDYYSKITDKKKLDFMYNQTDKTELDEWKKEFKSMSETKQKEYKGGEGEYVATKAYQSYLSDNYSTGFSSDFGNVLQGYLVENKKGGAYIYNNSKALTQLTNTGMSVEDAVKSVEAYKQNYSKILTQSIDPKNEETVKSVVNTASGENGLIEINDDGSAGDLVNGTSILSKGLESNVTSMKIIPGRGLIELETPTGKYYVNNNKLSDDTNAKLKMAQSMTLAYSDLSNNGEVMYIDGAYDPISKDPIKFKNLTESSFNKGKLQSFHNKPVYVAYRVYSTTTKDNSGKTFPIKKVEKIYIDQYTKKPIHKETSETLAAFNSEIAEFISSSYK
jgi:hypothetical protein